MLERISLDEVNLIHLCMSGTNHSNVNSDRASSFAGCWKNMPDEVYAEFVNEVAQRRQIAFSTRRKRYCDIFETPE